VICVGPRTRPPHVRWTFLKERAIRDTNGEQRTSAYKAAVRLNCESGAVTVQPAPLPWAPSASPRSDRSHSSVARLFLRWCSSKISWRS
jgi:hypothetical protein